MARLQACDSPCFHMFLSQKERVRSPLGRAWCENHLRRVGCVGPPRIHPDSTQRSVSGGPCFGGDCPDLGKEEGPRKKRGTACVLTLQAGDRGTYSAYSAWCSWRLQLMLSSKMRRLAFLETHLAHLASPKRKDGHSRGFNLPPKVFAGQHITSNGLWNLHRSWRHLGRSCKLLVR